MMSERRELNPLPLGPEPSVLPMNYSPNNQIITPDRKIKKFNYKKTNLVKKVGFLFN